MSSTDGQWVGKRRLPDAQISKSDLDRIVGRVTEGCLDISFVAKEHDRQKRGATLEELRDLARFDRQRSLTITFEYADDNKLELALTGRRSTYSWENGVGYERGQRVVEEWKELAGRAWLPSLAVWALRFAVPLVAGLGWFVALLTGALVAPKIGIVIFLVLASLAAIAFVGVSLGKRSPFLAVRAVNQPFISSFKRSAWTDTKFLVSVLAPLLNVAVVVWLSLGR